MISDVAVEEFLCELEEGLLAFVRQVDAVEVADGCLVVLCYLLFGLLFDFDLVVDLQHLLYFGLRVVGGSAEQLDELLSLCGLGGLKSLEQEVGLFVVFDVGACLFAEGLCVAVGVEKVVAQLEGESDVDAEVVEGVGVGLGRVGVEGSDFECCREQDGCLEPYHFEVFGYGDVVALLEVHIVLLPLADFHTCLLEDVEYLVEVGVWLPEEVLPGEDVHCVAREDGGVGVPLEVDGGFAASDG